ncbi:hypothetical protein MTO96_017110 [Rhipicephalus appendiculatus]
MACAQFAPGTTHARCDSGDAGAFPRHLRMPCTKEGDSDCQLLLYLRSTRELLLGASLELVEDKRRPGGLRLAVLRAPASPCPLPCTLDERRKEAALHYVEHLLSEHRCITAVEINGSTTQPQTLLAALGRNLAVKSVTVCLALDQLDQANVRVLEAVNELSHLEELEFASVSCNTPSPCEVSTYLNGPLMERRTEHLRRLDVSALPTEHGECSSTCLGAHLEPHHHRTCGARERILRLLSRQRRTVFQISKKKKGRHAKKTDA